MHPQSAVRRLGRRLGVLWLALFATCGLLSGNAAPAHADTTERWTTLNGATAESARFGWIRRRIEAVIRSGHDASR
ncbi:hypothetical protein [Streptomyces sp. NPDC059788]|uniref:hypothetical protein n=1 Tax=Streptomyces sp. NPDC059788 TaxID=3346948 RepID=UPI0036559BDF